MQQIKDMEFSGERPLFASPFWHVDGFTIKNSLFTEGGRAALWYSQNLVMTDTRVEAPKMFREMDGIRLEINPLALPERGIDKCANRSC